MKHDKAALVAAWKRRSCQDLKVVHILIGEDGMRETTLFHLQQSIEKALKAYLIWRAVNFPHTHDLEVLIVIHLNGWGLSSKPVILCEKII